MKETKKIIVDSTRGEGLLSFLGQTDQSLAQVGRWAEHQP